MCKKYIFVARKCLMPTRSGKAGKCVVWQKSADFAIKSLETSKKYYDSAK